MMMLIDVTIGPVQITAEIADPPPMGWRFWALAGFPGDPNTYGGSRCLAFTILDIDGHDRWLCGMELDESFRLLCTHDLFPCANQDGAEDFALAMLRRHARQARLF